MRAFRARVVHPPIGAESPCAMVASLPKGFVHRGWFVAEGSVRGKPHAGDGGAGLHVSRAGLQDFNTRYQALAVFEKLAMAAASSSWMSKTV